MAWSPPGNYMEITGTFRFSLWPIDRMLTVLWHVFDRSHEYHNELYSLTVHTRECSFCVTNGSLLSSTMELCTGT